MTTAVNPDQAAPPAAQTAQGRYEQLATDRTVYLTRARAAAELTIPSLIPPEGASGATDLPQPYQSVGARGVNNLSAKLLLALFPPGASWFRLSADQKAIQELAAAGQIPPEEVVAEIDNALGAVERQVLQRFNTGNIRASLFEAFKHLLVAGNALVVLKDTGLKLFPLTQYVVKRDLEGNVLEILTKESLSRKSLPNEAQTLLVEKGDSPDDPTATVDLYTWVVRKSDGSWRVHQEVSGHLIESTRGSYPKGKCPWLPVRWTRTAGEDYGRAMCDEYGGDLLSLDALSQVLAEGGMAMAKLLFLVDPSAILTRRQLEEAKNLDVIEGNARDVSVLQADKAMDLSVAKAQADKIEQRLEQAFLLTSSIQRNAERVTAEEIRLMAGELEQALGGVYSMFAEELQAPIVSRLIFQMQRAKEIPRFPDKTVSPQIVTGLEGLGRTSDLQKLDSLVAGLAQLFGPEAVAEYVSVGAYAERRATALGIDVAGVIRSEGQVAERRAQVAQQQATEKLGPEMIRSQTAQSIAAADREAESAASTTP